MSVSPNGCTPIAFAGQLSGWTPDASGAIRLLGSDARTLAEFTEATGGSYEALREGDGVYFLVPPGAAVSADVTPEEMMGEWAVLRVAGSEPLCRWTFSDAAASPAPAYRVVVALGCAASIADFAPATWRVEGGIVLVTSGAGQPALRFARQEDGTWAKTPERGRPLFLQRP